MAKNKDFSSSTTTFEERSFEGSSSSRGSAVRDKFSNVGDTASQRIDTSPLLALGAGAALGAVLGAVLPRTAKEKELLAPLGSKIAEAGTGAFDRARETGKQKFDEMAGDSVRQFFGASSSTDGSSSSSSSTAGNL